MGNRRMIGSGARQKVLADLSLHRRRRVRVDRSGDLRVVAFHRQSILLLRGELQPMGARRDFGSAVVLIIILGARLVFLLRRASEVLHHFVEGRHAAPERSEFARVRDIRRAFSQGNVALILGQEVVSHLRQPHGVVGGGEREAVVHSFDLLPFRQVRLRDIHPFVLGSRLPRNNLTRREFLQLVGSRLPLSPTHVSHIFPEEFFGGH
ncbi:hypothetical protein T484DRAFT_1974800 [Baffinella frigidus]|nr:hypothetical protein T484DRAFT_1974800 [Cryptophyta sp. CCMP2293]|mmetsp:Transcript_42452/g.100967  ORF Transcript_42452/g.100967 Transcript_42452/m.100967 type:complete len:208 (-) Transcript_42452:129-752(-)